MRLRQTTAVFAGLAVLSLALYAPVLNDYFISDDFVLVRFVRTWSGSWLDFLVPWRIYSDPIVDSRYKPFFVYLLAAQDALFGDGVVGRHLMSVLTHAGVGTGAFVFMRRLGGSFIAALIAAVLFVSSRLHSQAVSWTSSLFHLVSVALFLWGLVALLSTQRLWVFGVLAAAGLLLDPELVVAAPVVVLLALYQRREVTLARGALVMTVLTIGCAAANLISLEHFPDEDFAFRPRLDRFALVFLDLFLPFDVPLAAKACTLLIVVGASLMFARKDPLIVILLLSAVPAAALWSSIGDYQVTPRHLYLPALFTALAVGRLASLVLGHRPILLGLATSVLVVLSAAAMRRYDFVLFDGRAEVGARLRKEQLAARAGGEQRQIWVQPTARLTEEDLRYFAPELAFVEGPGDGARVIDSGESEYVRRLGPDFAERYWPWRWFSSSTRRE